jgi:hypothetical protein
MDEHGFSGADAWVASDRVSPGGAQRRKVVRKDMADQQVIFAREFHSVGDLLTRSLGRTRPSRQREMNVASGSE